jgi:Tfp pilus assembly protein PilF
MYSDARLAIDRSLNDKTLNGKVKGEVYTALTDYFLKQNRFEEALEAVEMAVKNTKKKRRATRLLFIQGQLFQKAGELKKASDSYKKVLKSNPS